jgi:hypothetical protein
LLKVTLNTINKSINQSINRFIEVESTDDFTSYSKTNIPVYDTAKLNVTTNQLIVIFDFIRGNDLYKNDIDNEIHFIVKCKVNK